ncbi:YHS domain protein [mine drainage metagenome]|uniref:YHS domain protein n=1 Tax=mine drainage metagenome TaxID=410659 RepID=A0A1J5S1C5_9ZZZZ
MGSNGIEESTLIDPACGAPVDASSPYSGVRGGALFYFCSEACRSRFLANPLNFVVMSMPESETPIPEPSVVQSVEVPSHSNMADRLAHEAENEPEHSLFGRFRGLIASWLLARTERRHAERAGDELLALYRTVSANHPELSGRELYRSMVMARTGCDATDANRVLDCAEESFAAWPVSRELTLCDVVHYLSVAEFIETHGGAPWMHSNIKFVVTSRIPHNLCVNHKDT